ncbi:MAG: fumarylacetoacetate hydrolase family protein [Bacteroidaceae bacterium]|nr:fumarylacetoacetate hydrolase family protein [Bacteroidaceae bacterium]
MKILAVGMNYAEHIDELHNKVLKNTFKPTEPVIFSKQESSLLRDHKPFFVPDFAERFDYETELVVRIAHVGKDISERFAHRYYEEVTVGIDFTARDLQNRLKQQGLPWDICKGFDGSAAVGEFVKIKDLGGDIQNINFRLDKNGQTVQQGCSCDMLFTVDQIIAYASRFFTLKTGDLIFTGTPVGVGPVQEGDILDGYIGERHLLHQKIK